MTKNKGIAYFTSVNLRDLKTKYVLGNFINRLILNIDIDENDEFLDILTKTKKNVKEGLNYKDVPVEIVLKNIEIDNYDLSLKYPDGLISIYINMIYRNNDMVPIFKKEIKNTKKNSKFDITFLRESNK